MGALDDAMRLMVISRSIYQGKYDTLIDNVSAFEILSEEINQKREAEQEALRQKEQEKQAKAEEKAQKEQERADEKAKREEERAKKAAEKEAEKARKNSPQYKLGKAGGRVVNSALGSIGRKIGTEIIKNLFK